MTIQRKYFLASGLRDSINEGYSLTSLRKDVIAGITVGIIALPLAMALAIASGVPPQYGLYTAIVAGAIIALSGGARIAVSGPTAAFVVLLLPISNQFGLAGLLIITMFAGLIQCLMGLLKLGRLIEHIPFPVVVGFTAGIGVVIAFLQVKDFAGLPIASMPDSFVERLQVLLNALPDLSSSDFVIGLACLCFLILWQTLIKRFPPHLPAILLSVLLVWLFQQFHPEFEVSTIGSRFSFSFEGNSYHGIPSIPPHFHLPWKLAGAEALLSDWGSGIKYAIRIAFLGAIESLLCAVILDSLTNRKHDSDCELIAQGLGNMIAPFFGAITATSAIARSSANFRAGAVSPISALVHSLVILLSILFLAPFMSYIPMASLAAILLLVAWHVCDFKQCIAVIRTGSLLDSFLLLLCFSMTVVFDMVLAVVVGVLAHFLMSRRIAATVPPA